MNIIAKKVKYSISEKSNLDKFWPAYKKRPCRLAHDPEKHTIGQVKTDLVQVSIWTSFDQFSQA